MNPSKTHTHSLRWQPAAALMIALALTSATQAFVFQYGDVKGSFDTTISVGGLARLNSANVDYLGLNDIPGAPANTGRQKSSNNDDGDLNYHAGLVSFLVKASHDLQVNYKNVGAFARGYYFNDYVNTNGIRNRTALNSEALKLVGSNGYLLDAYVYAKGSLGSMPAKIAIGRQVLSWGESTFIPNGLNAINPVDVAKLRTPGSELKEALLPINMISGSLSINEDISLEAFYLLSWERTRVDPPGSYFSTNDFVAKGGTKVFLGFGNVADTSSFGAIPRGTDKEPGGSGQYGVNMKWLAKGLGDTEFGFYYMNYHSRLPVISAQTPTAQIAGFVVPRLTTLLIEKAGVPAAAAGPTAVGLLTQAAIDPSVLSAGQLSLIAGAKQLAFFDSAATGRYLIEFPKDIGLWGASFNTSVKGIALQGEISYRSNQPLQVDDVELLFATLSSINPAFAANNQIGSFIGVPGATHIDGFRRTKVWTGQFTATKVGSGLFGAAQSTLLAEMGFVNATGLPSKDVLRFDGPGTTVGGNLTAMTLTGNGASGSDPASAFADKFSWGYQLVGRLDYNNVYHGVNMSPLIVFAHDVSGNTPLPMGNFIHGRKSITLGADFSFQNAWAFEVRYVNFFGAGRFNLLSDRDYVSANLKYSF